MRTLTAFGIALITYGSISVSDGLLGCYCASWLR